ncbi:MAG: hypothetical protein QOD66_2404 [Solirubrobacteraceae bacterium]|jgi:uncharacterized protein YbjT (DUF2867 family)|nr:hypothetical protein [Solirubrobacteraceae bacterium]
MADEHDRILLTGATGYVGGRLLARLEREQHPVRCLTRRPHTLGPRVAGSTEIVAGDLLAPESLSPAMRDVRTAYYLVHSMDALESFEELDRRAATNFATAAREAGVQRIVYLSGLGSGGNLSAHLASRHEVGEILNRSGVPTIELRASIVIGAGSASFETVRAVVEGLPAIPAPKGVETFAQPIAIEDLIEYLVAALTLPARSAIFEIGGHDQVSYAEVMREYARQRHLHRRVVPLPRQTLRASRMLLSLLTPVYGRVAATMIDSLRNETVVRDTAAREAFAVTPRGLPEAIHGALMSEDDEFAQMSWSDVLAASEGARWGGTPMSRRLVTSRVELVYASPPEVFARVQRIGGTRGWYGADWFWTLRGALDKLRGGNGMRRGRRDPHELRAGDPIDFWRVVRIEPDRGLLLTAEMKMPGRLWLDYELTSKDGDTVLRLTTVFDPAGYAGLAYWYLLYPVHRAIFTAMLRGLGRVTGTDHHQPSDDDRGGSGSQESNREDLLQMIVDSGKDRMSTASSLTDLVKVPRFGVNPLSKECSQ